MTFYALSADIRTWHSNIEQHASEGVNKILIGNKCDWDDKRAVSVQQGRELADEFGLRFLETSAKANEGVEEAFFTLARYVRYHLLALQPRASSYSAREQVGDADFGGGHAHDIWADRSPFLSVPLGRVRVHRDIKLRLIDTQEPAAGSAANSAALGGAKGNVSVGGGAPKAGGGCC